ncbi:MAG TPA: DMT family transporter [Longilinea sp.]|nr:DMT family transporter [Longilinea sp.]
MSSSPSSPTQINRSTPGYLIAVVSAMFLSTTAVFIRYLTENFALPALILSFWRDLFVVLTLLPIFLIWKPKLLHIKRRDLLYMIGYGFVLALFNSAWTFSVSLNGAAVATVLAYCSGAFTAVLGWWLLKEHLGWAKIVAVVTILAGCVLISGAYRAEAWNTNIAGIMAGVLSGLCYAVYSLLGRSASQRGLNPWTTLIYTFGFATVFLLAVNLIPGGALPGSAAALTDLLWLGDSVTGWVVLFLLAAVPTVMGFGLYNTSLTMLPSSVVNLIVSLEPVFTTLTAYLFLGERLDGKQIGGAFLVMTGVLFLRFFERWNENQAKKLA